MKINIDIKIVITETKFDNIKDFLYEKNILKNIFNILEPSSGIIGNILNIRIE